jgi:hypothetical protein
LFGTAPEAATNAKMRWSSPENRLFLTFDAMTPVCAQRGAENRPTRQAAGDAGGKMLDADVVVDARPAGWEPSFTLRVDTWTPRVMRCASRFASEVAALGYGGRTDEWREAGVALRLQNVSQTSRNGRSMSQYTSRTLAAGGEFEQSRKNAKTACRC